MIQTSLNLTRIKQTSVKPVDVLAMKAALHFNGWVKRVDLQKTLPWPERKFRAVCKASRGEILGSNLGYGLTRQVSLEDAHHVSRRLRSMAKELHLSALAIEQIIHRPNGVSH